MSTIKVEKIQHPNAASVALTLDTNGKVGIGTNSPNELLQVNGNIKAGTGDGSWIGFGDSTSHAMKFKSSLDGIALNGYGGIAFETFGANERMRIDSSGRVGIGTSSINAGTALHVARNTAGNISAIRLSGNDGAGDGGAGINFADNETVKWSVFTRRYSSNNRLYISTGENDANSSKVTITEGGSVGIGTTTPSSFANFTNLTIQGGSSGSNLDFFNSSGVRKQAIVANASNGLSLECIDAGAINFNTNNTERARIDSSGRLLVGTSSAPLYGPFQVYKSSDNIASFIADSGFVPIFAWNKTAGSGTFIEFGTTAAYTIRGSITYNSGTGQTSYNLVSDYRAKSLLGNVENSGEIIDALKVYRGLMNGATIERPMLVAHETQEVAPYCVTGEKDAVDDEGNPVYQQMDHQVLVPLLIAEIQQLRIRIAALESA